MSLLTFDGTLPLLRFSLPEHQKQLRQPPIGIPPPSAAAGVAAPAKEYPGMAAAGPSYAPYDPTLPKPWKGLVDGNTGNLYFWNPETNVTQYQRPTAELPSSPTLEKSEAAGSQQSVIPSSQEQEDRNTNEEDNRCRGNVDKREEAGIPFDGHSPNADDIQCTSPKIKDEKCSEGDFVVADLPHAEVKPACNSSILFNGASASQPSKSSADLYCKKHEIRVLGGDIPMPFMTFESTKFPQEILRTIHNAGFSAPTPIQAQTWPIALQRRDIIAVAKTGSGKTLGYLIPGFYHVKYLKRNNKMGPTVLILSPTRELATQILDEAEKFGSSSGIASTCLYGGAPKGPQLGALARGTDIVVATPGRLNDILEMRKVSLQQVSYLVLDEADRMLDMGFEPQIRKIVKEIPERHQTLMYTATWPKEVRKIAADLLVKPAQVNIGNVDELVANKSITQHVKVLASMEKRQCLKQLLRSLQPGRTIIFCSTKKMCDQLAENLDEHFGAAAIHGDKSQGERDNVLNEFRSGKSPILVATDVAARGLDVKDVRVVINYDFPTGIEDYVHRIGRTGRAGATGVAYTFFTDLDAKYASGLVKILEGAGQIVPPELRNMASYGGGYGDGGRSSRQWGSGGGGGGNKWNGGESCSKSNFGSCGGQSSSGGWSDRSESKGFDNNAHQVGNHSYGGNGMRARSRSPVRRGWGGS